MSLDSNIGKVIQIITQSPSYSNSSFNLKT